MTRGRRSRISAGIYADAGGLAATVKVGRIQREKRFPLGTDLKELRTWQKRMRGHLLSTAPLEAAPVIRRSSFARDVVRYLKQRKGLPSYAADRAHLAAWVERFGKKLRASVTTEDVRLALAHWREHGQRRKRQKTARPLAVRTVRHRLRVLRELYHALDGPKAMTPTDDVQLPAVPRTTPQDVDVSVIQKVAKALEHRWPKDHARLLVLATTGRRPVELMRTNPLTDLNPKRKLWMVPAAKGGEPTPLPLNADMVAAWKRLIGLKATGAYSTTLYGQHLRKCGWPRHVRPYNVRHALAMAILRAGGDLSDVQVHLGHTSIDTTRRFYAGIIAARAIKTSQRLTGRLGASLLSASDNTAHTRRIQAKPAIVRSVTTTQKERRKVAK